MASIGDGFALSDGVELRNRIVSTAHGSGAVANGQPLDRDIEYWGRLAQGGAAMAVIGGNAVAEQGTIRDANRTQLWRPDVVPGLTRRASALKAGGAVPILQMVHLGRETLRAESYYHPIGPSRIRSRREPTAPREMTDADVDSLINAYLLGARHAHQAGFTGIEMHAAHGYLLSLFLSPTVNAGREAYQRTEVIRRIGVGIRAMDPAFVVGIRMSVGDEDDAGLGLEPALAETLGALEDAVTYVNLTVGMRTRYVRDMSYESPGILPDVARIRAMTRLPLLVSHGFRDVNDIQAALDAGADMVGMARGLIADPDLPRKILAGEPQKIRPCVECNEDCRLFNPSLLCTVNPDLAPVGAVRRPAVPLLVRGVPEPAGAVAVIGAGPGGLEAALTLAHDPSRKVTLWERQQFIGGGMHTASLAPHRSGWQRMLAFYERELRASAVRLRLGESPDARTLSEYATVVDATGAEEVLPEGWTHPRVHTTTDALRAGAEAFTGLRHVAVLDDGFGWWPAINVMEALIAAEVPEVTFVSPSTGLASSIPAESRVQLMDRLHYPGLRLRVAATVDRSGDDFILRDLYGADTHRLVADLVVVAGERRPRSPGLLTEVSAPTVVRIGDSITPRKFAHAIAEGREIGLQLIGQG